MKHLKPYMTYIKENLSDFTTQIQNKYVVLYDNSDYESILLYDMTNKKLVAYVTTGNSDFMNEKIMQLGTIWKEPSVTIKGLGMYLQKCLMAYLNCKVLPSDNISDIAKVMQKNILKDSEFNSQKSEKGHYTVFAEEDYLNYIVELKPELVDKYKSIIKQNNVVSKEDVLSLINFGKNSIFDQEEGNYTIGQSRVRLKIYEEKEIKNIPYTDENSNPSFVAKLNI